MKKIIELRTKLNGNNELKDLIRLEIKSPLNKQIEEINWDNFYFTIDRYKSLYKYIASNRCDHITCIEGTIKEFHEPTDNFPYYNIKIKSHSIKRIGSINIEVPSLQLQLDNELIYKFI